VNAAVGKIVRVASAVLTGVIAFSGYAGVVGRFHPTYLAAALVVLSLGWLMQRISSPTARQPRPQLHDTQLAG
jgi:hypothetical protein